jgi:hypothetical protein
MESATEGTGKTGNVTEVHNKTRECSKEERCGCSDT